MTRRPMAPRVAHRTYSDGTRAMSGPQLRVVADSLGLTRRDVATVTGAHERSVSRWLEGVIVVPEAAARRLWGLQERAAREVRAQEKALGRRKSPVIRTFRDDAVFAAAHAGDDELADVPASWHRMVAARLLEAFPDAPVVYVDDEQG